MVGEKVGHFYTPPYIVVFKVINNRIVDNFWAPLENRMVVLVYTMYN
jgi:hypothetical protein